jgi:hypothetical protein
MASRHSQVSLMLRTLLTLQKTHIPASFNMYLVINNCVTPVKVTLSCASKHLTVCSPAPYCIFILLKTTRLLFPPQLLQRVLPNHLFSFAVHLYYAASRSAPDFMAISRSLIEKVIRGRSRGLFELHIGVFLDWAKCRNLSSMTSDLGAKTGTNVLPKTVALTSRQRGLTDFSVITIFLLYNSVLTESTMYCQESAIYNFDYSTQYLNVLIPIKIPENQPSQSSSLR